MVKPKNADRLKFCSLYFQVQDCSLAKEWIEK